MFNNTIKISVVWLNCNQTDVFCFRLPQSNEEEKNNDFQNKYGCRISHNIFCRNLNRKCRSMGNAKKAHTFAKKIFCISYVLTYAKIKFLKKKIQKWSFRLRQ